MEILPALLVLIFAQAAIAQLPVQGDCKNLAGVKPFNLEDYDGIWFEAQRYNFIPEMTGKCVSLNFTVVNDGSMNVQVRFIESRTSTPLVWPGHAVLTDGVVNNDARIGSVQLTVTLLNPLFPAIGVLRTYNYRVVATDYESYAIHYACFSLFGVHFPSVWVLSRDPKYPQSVRDKVLDEMRALGLDDSLLQQTDQNCDNPPLPITMG